MEIKLTGKIIRVLDPREGMSANTGKSWKVQEFVLLDEKQAYICFEVFGEQRLQDWALGVGDIVELTADLESREWNGKFFTRISAWKLDSVTRVSAPSAPVQVFPEREQESTDELPF